MTQDQDSSFILPDEDCCNDSDDNMPDLMSAPNSPDPRSLHEDTRSEANMPNLTLESETIIPDSNAQKSSVGNKNVATPSTKNKNFSKTKHKDVKSRVSYAQVFNKTKNKIPNSYWDGSYKKLERRIFEDVEIKEISDKEFQCGECGKVCNSSSNILAHIRTNHFSKFNSIRNILLIIFINPPLFRGSRVT